MSQLIRQSRKSVFAQATSAFLFVITVLSMIIPTPPAQAAEWQWSVLDGEARTYLWIPPSCKRVRAVVMANHNMIEQGILEHPIMRKTLGELGIAEMWTVPGMDIAFDFYKGADQQFERIIGALVTESGYEELRVAPVVTLGHSANATWPWNFAAWNPNRTLAILSVHGDAPQTNLTGYGRANIEWGNRNIDGVPALMVMGEYEWWEDRLTPAFTFKAKHPDATIAFLGDAGHGHFDYSDELVEYLAMFIRKAAEARLPKIDANSPLDRPVVLKPVNPKAGWRVDRWRKDQAPTAPSAPYEKYKGDLTQAFWNFDKEMARATEAYYAVARGKKPQLLSVTDGKQPVEKGVGEPVTPQFIPLEDGLSFRLKTAFMDAVPKNNGKATFWTGLPAGSPLGHGNGPIKLTKSVGPATQTGPDTFTIRFGRAEYTPNRRNNDIWIIASHPGDEQYKSAVQQSMVRIQPNIIGVDQHINFPVIADQKTSIQTVKLAATSDAGLPVSYYVLAGLAEVEGNALRFTHIPPRSKFPLKVTVVAWQWGHSGVSPVKTAIPGEQTFSIVR